MKYKIKIKKGTIVDLRGLPYILKNNTIVYCETYPQDTYGIKQIKIDKKTKYKQNLYEK